MQEKVKGGDGSMARLVFGVSTTETEDGVRRTVNRILGGGSILTVFHEDAHGLRREAHARGILTRQDDIAILRAVDTVMDGRPGREGQRLSLLPQNFDTLSQSDQDVAIDEGISELMEAEVIRTRKGGGARQLPAGIISRNMAAIARLAGPQAAGRFGSFIEAFRGFFGLATDRAHRIRRSLADGSLDKADYDAYFGKLVGHAGGEVMAGVANASRPPLPDAKKLGGLLDMEGDVSFSLGSKKPGKSLEATILTAVAEARTKTRTTDGETLRRTGRFWLSLHGVEGVQQLPMLRSNRLEDLVGEAASIHPGLSYLHLGETSEADVSVIRDDHGSAYIKTKDGKVWVDTSEAGGSGTYGSGKHVNRVKASMSPAVYQIAQTYARNNGLKFTIDPNGTSNIADFRRWPQLLSSAIRMGATTHIDGTNDVAGWKDGDHEHNAGLLAMHEYEYVRHFFPEIDGLRLSDDSATMVDHAGAPVSRQTLADLLVGERHPSRLGIGETTLRRALVTGQTAAERGMESGSETGASQPGERRIHPGAVQNFVPDLGSGTQGSRAEHALKEISYSIGSESSSDSNPTNQPHRQDHGQEGRMVPGDGTEQEVPGGSEAEIGRRIREALSRAEEDDVQGRVGSGSESIVHFFGESEVLKDTQSSGLIRLSQDGEYLYDRSFDAAEEKARIINALGGMRTRAISWEGRIMIIQERGTPITETEYLSVELPFGIEPTRHGTYKIQIDGDEYLIADLKPENFVKDSQGNIRLIDLITGKVAKGSTPK